MENISVVLEALISSAVDIQKCFVYSFSLFTLADVAFKKKDEMKGMQFNAWRKGQKITSKVYVIRDI